MEASTTSDSMAHLAEELRVLVRERGRKQAHVLRELGWDKSWFTDLREKPSRLKIPDLLALLGVLGVEPSDFFERVHGKADLAPEVVKVREALAAAVSELDVLAEEIREGPKVAWFVGWAARSLLRPLLQALDEGPSAPRVEEALAETLDVAWTVRELGLGSADGSQPSGEG